MKLRFEGVDAPELHHGKDTQPLGDKARDALLGWIGFDAIKYDHVEPTRVNSAMPEMVRAAILVQMVETHGQPVAYVLVDSGDKLPADGTWVNVDSFLFDRTLNMRLLSEGQAYYTVYTSTPAAHRHRLRMASEEARLVGLGVWGRDETSEWVLTDQSSIGPGGLLILPKLFRRCTDYIKAVYKDSLATWSTGCSPVR